MFCAIPLQVYGKAFDTVGRHLANVMSNNAVHYSTSVLVLVLVYITVGT